MAPAIKKPLSSYMLFCNDRRKQVTEENPGLRIGAIQKLISVQWKELTPEEKEHYVQLAAKDKERYEKERLENPVEVEEQGGDEDAAKQSHACVYPLGRVKKIIQSDPEAGKVSRDALIAISKASELFVQFLGTKSYEQALYRNKRQVKMADVTHAIQTTGSLDWLRDDFPDVKPAPGASSGAQHKPKAAEEKKDLPDAAAFFRPQQQQQQQQQESRPAPESIDAPASS